MLINDVSSVTQRPADFSHRSDVAVRAETITWPKWREREKERIKIDHIGTRSIRQGMWSSDSKASFDIVIGSYRNQLRQFIGTVTIHQCRPSVRPSVAFC